MKVQRLVDSFFLIVVTALLFLPGLGSSHLFDWDEINFAECAREMVVTGDYANVTINYIPFWEKPPVFIWLQAFSMEIFGVNEFAARFPDALCGILTILILYRIGQRLYDRQFGFIWALVYAGSILPHFYFKSAIIDPWFNLFIFLGFYHFILFANEQGAEGRSGYRRIILSAVFIGVAILTKGPVALLVFGLVAIIHWIFSRFRFYFNWKHVAVFLTVVGTVGSIWFIMLIASGNSKVINEFFEYQVRLFQTEDATHGGSFFYHWILLLIGCFPASFPAVAAYFSRASDTPFRAGFKKWMAIMLLAVLVLFSIVKTKIPHYSSLCYFPLTFLAAWYLWWYFQNGVTWKKWLTPALTTSGLFLSMVFITVTFIESFKEQLIPYVKDPFAVENLSARANWQGYEFIAGGILLAGTVLFFLLHKKGMTRTPVILLFVFSLATINLAILMITPRVEEYSQNAAIEFYKSKSDESCYIETLGFKSYAPYFYGKLKNNPLKDENFISYYRSKGITDISKTDVHAQVEDWLLRGNAGIPVYFVCKINREKEYLGYFPFLREIGRKNGFVFFTK